MSAYAKSKRLPFYCKEHIPNTTHDSKVQKTAKFSMETEKNPMTGRRKTRPAVWTTKRSTRRNIASLTSYNSSEVDESLQEAYETRWA
jgi:hypothetical protein